MLPSYRTNMLISGHRNEPTHHNWSSLIQRLEDRRFRCISCQDNFTGRTEAVFHIVTRHLLPDEIENDLSVHRKLSEEMKEQVKLVCTCRNNCLHPEMFCTVLLFQINYIRSYLKKTWNKANVNIFIRKFLDLISLHYMQYSALELQKHSTSFLHFTCDLHVYILQRLEVEKKTIEN